MASKTESTLLNMVLALFFVALASATSLGYIYELTKDPIKEAKSKKKLAAIQLVVPEFDNNPSEELIKLPMGAPGDTLEFYPAFKNGEHIGTAVRTYSDKAFTERIYIMVGFQPDGKIISTQVLEHKETPGLGDKMSKKKSDWCDQYVGKDPNEFNLKVKKDGGDVDGITAATITSRAFSDAIDRAFKSLKKIEIKTKE